MITGLRGATIWSEDLNRRLPFYRDGLHLPVTIETSGFVVLGPREGPSLALGTHCAVRGRNTDPARPMVGLKTDDIIGDYKRLKDAGVDFVETPTAYPNVRVATLKDPDGKLAQLLQFLR